MNVTENRLLGAAPPRGFIGFPDCHTNATLYRAYLWGKRNQERLAISGQMAFSNITRELQRRGVLRLPKPQPPDQACPHCTHPDDAVADAIVAFGGATCWHNDGGSMNEQNTEGGRSAGVKGGQT